MAKHVMMQHKYEKTELIIPTTPPPPDKVKLPVRPRCTPPEPPEVKLELPRSRCPSRSPSRSRSRSRWKPRSTLPVIKASQACRSFWLRSPRPRLTAAMPAQDNSVKPSTAPVHLGDTFGVTPNPNATRPATVAAIGNPYGGMQGPAVAPHGVVGSTGIGNGPGPARTPASSARWPRPAFPAPPEPRNGR